MIGYLVVLKFAWIATKHLPPTCQYLDATHANISMTVNGTPTLIISTTLLTHDKEIKCCKQLKKMFKIYPNGYNVNNIIFTV